MLQIQWHSSSLSHPSVISLFSQSSALSCPHCHSSSIHQMPSDLSTFPHLPCNNPFTSTPTWPPRPSPCFPFPLISPVVVYTGSFPAVLCQLLKAPLYLMPLCSSQTKIWTCFCLPDQSVWPPAWLFGIRLPECSFLDLFVCSGLHVWLWSLPASWSCKHLLFFVNKSLICTSSLLSAFGSYSCLLEPVVTSGCHRTFCNLTLIKQRSK